MTEQEKTYYDEYLFPGASLIRKEQSLIGIESRLDEILKKLAAAVSSPLQSYVSVEGSLNENDIAYLKGKGYDVEYNHVYAATAISWK